MDKEYLQEMWDKYCGITDLACEMENITVGPNDWKYLFMVMESVANSLLNNAARGLGVTLEEKEK